MVMDGQMFLRERIALGLGSRSPPLARRYERVVTGNNQPVPQIRHLLQMKHPVNHSWMSCRKPGKSQSQMIVTTIHQFQQSDHTYRFTLIESLLPPSSLAKLKTYATNSKSNYTPLTQMTW